MLIVPVHFFFDIGAFAYVEKVVHSDIIYYIASENMDTNFENNKQNIVATLNKKVENLKCPICATSSFALGGGFFAHDLQQDLSQRQMGGINIPTIPIICTNCGYVMEFAAGTLGLLPKKEEQAETTPKAQEKHDE